MSEVSGFISPPFNGASLKARVTLKASATLKCARGFTRLASAPVGQGRRAAIRLVGRGTPAEHSHLEECACDPARTVGLCARVDVKGERWLALAVKKEKSLAFSEGTSPCPCLCLLIYEPEKEISHLSLFIFFLHIFFFSQ